MSKLIYLFNNLKNSILLNYNYICYKATKFNYKILKLLEVWGYIYNVSWIFFFNNNFLIIILKSFFKNYIFTFKIFLKKEIFIKRKFLFKLNKNKFYILSNSKGLMTLYKLKIIKHGCKLICYLNI